MGMQGASKKKRGTKSTGTQTNEIAEMLQQISSATRYHHNNYSLQKTMLWHRWHKVGCPPSVSEMLEQSNYSGWGKRLLEHKLGEAVAMLAEWAAMATSSGNNSRWRKKWASKLFYSWELITEYTTTMSFPNSHDKLWCVIAMSFSNWTPL